MALESLADALEDQEGVVVLTFFAEGAHGGCRPQLRKLSQALSELYWMARGIQVCAGAAG